MNYGPNQQYLYRYTCKICLNLCFKLSSQGRDFAFTLNVRYRLFISLKDDVYTKLSANNVVMMSACIVFIIIKDRDQGCGD